MRRWKCLTKSNGQHLDALKKCPQWGTWKGIIRVCRRVCSLRWYNMLNMIIIMILSWYEHALLFDHHHRIVEREKKVAMENRSFTFHHFSYSIYHGKVDTKVSHDWCSKWIDYHWVEITWWLIRNSQEWESSFISVQSLKVKVCTDWNAT